MPTEGDTRRRCAGPCNRYLSPALLDRWGWCRVCVRVEHEHYLDGLYDDYRAGMLGPRNSYPEGWIS